MAITLTLGPAAGAENLPARGGRNVLAASESAEAVLVGRTREVRKVDLHGHTAELHVEQVLGGRAKVGDTVRIAWEELARGRPVRFENGSRVLVALESMPDLSLWHKRFPKAADRVLAVARDGEAFLRDPDSTTLHVLAHYLALGRGAREDPAGLAYLAEIVAKAAEPLALEALAKLGEQDDLRARLPETSARLLARSAGDGTKSETLGRGALALIGAQKLHAARAVVEELAREGKPMRAFALAALGALDDGLSPDLVQELLASPDGGLRAVGASYLKAEGSDATLAKLASADAEPRVRTVAAARLIERRGVAALPQVLPVLADDDPAVRAGTARRIAALGDAAVPALAELARSGPERAAQGAVLALSFAGGAAGKELAAIAHDHPNEAIRTLAGLALGRVPGHTH